MACCLCLNHNMETIHIFSVDGEELHIAAILDKHFWFTPHVDDPMLTEVCHSCWLKVNNFHEFYMHVQEAHRQLEVQNIKFDSVECKLEAQDNDFAVFTNPKNGIVLPEVPCAITEQDPLEVQVKLSTPQQMDIDNVDFKKTLRRSQRNSEQLVGTPKRERHETVDGGNGERRCLNSADQPTKADKAIAAEVVVAPKLDAIDEKIANFLSLYCDICRVEQPKFANLKRHMQSAHQNTGYAVCCNKRFRKRAHLMDHVHRHLNPEYFKCNECDKVFADRLCMNNHKFTKHPADEKKTFQCPQCPNKYAKAFLLERHRVKHEERSHICDACGKGFHSKTLLAIHIRNVHGDYGIMCHVCAKLINGPAAFARHQLEHAGVALPKVQCDICGSWHKDKRALCRHKKMHNVEGVEYVCPECGRACPNQWALFCHRKYMHQNERTHVCEVCQKAFKKAIALKEHMTTHTGEVLYNCTYCSKTFNSSANMYSHRKRVHSAELEAAKRKENALMLEKTQVRENIKVPTGV